MTSALQHLLAQLGDHDPYNYRFEDVRAMQLQAADERFQQQRRRMQVLDQRARDTGTEKISQVTDVLPLFFSDSTYKSYPESLVEQRNWKGLGAWAEATSAGLEITKIDADGALDIDAWLERLRAAGQYLYVSSGTSGKVSLFHASQLDRDNYLAMYVACWKFATGAVPDRNRPIFAMAPIRGQHLIVDIFSRAMTVFGRPGAIYTLSDEPLRVNDVNSLGRLRRAIAAGTAAPGEIEAFERKSAEKQAEMENAFGRLADAVVAHRHEPSMFLGTWGTEYMLVKAALARGLENGVHPESIIQSGGGLKGIVAPPDFKEQVYNGLGLAHSQFLLFYGMSEIGTLFPACAERRYHIAPWLIPIVVDKEGERVLEPENGLSTGRLAFFDLSLDGRWGALISGDHGTVDLNPCPCGRAGPTVHDTIVRYIDLPGGDDKVSCAGTIDAYVRGAIGSA